MPKPTHDQRLEQIAKQHLGIETLETRNSDSLDFHDVAVWGVKTALEAAYQAGRKSAGGSDLADALRDNLSPHAVALIAAKCYVSYAKVKAGETACQPESESTWFANMLVEMLGRDQYESLCEEMQL